MDQISYDFLKELMKKEKINLVDIRENYLYQRKTLSGAVNIPYSLLKRMPEKYLQKEEVYYFFCQSGILSEQLKNSLNRKGYHIISVVEGFEDFSL